MRATGSRIVPEEIPHFAEEAHHFYTARAALHDHPPRPPKPNRLWHLGKIVFNKTYWHTVPRGRV